MLFRSDVKSNYIYTVEDYLPEKEEAIRYLNGENKEVPEIGRLIYTDP